MFRLLCEYRSFPGIDFSLRPTKVQYVAHVKTHWALVACVQSVLQDSQAALHHDVLQDTSRRDVDRAAFCRNNDDRTCSAEVEQKNQLGDYRKWAENLPFSVTPRAKLTLPVIVR
jgi:hypothetical protein